MIAPSVQFRVKWQLMAYWRLRHVAVPVYSLTLSLLILGPLLQPGYLLLRDAVSTPRSFLTDTSLGLTEAPARAVPQDAFLAVLSSFCDGGVLVKGLLLLALTLAGCGAARLSNTLLPQAGLSGQFVAVTLSLWNPYVAQRLSQGHWSLLLGYAALCWVVVTSVKLRNSSDRTLWFQLGFWLAFAGITPSGAILATIMAFTLLAHRLRRLSAVACLSATASAPWIIATFLNSQGFSSSDPAGVAAFAARAEPGLGTLGSLAGLGGIWNAEAEPYSRTTLFAVFSTIIFLLIVAIGTPIALRKGPRPIVPLLAALSAAAILGPALLATDPGLMLGRWLILHVPGVGLFRDTQKLVALALPFYVLAGSAATISLKRYLPSPLPAFSLCLMLFIALPDLLWGVNGTLKPVQYPQGWTIIANKIGAEPGDVAVLPNGLFRRFPWAHGTTVLDPAARLIPANVISTGELRVSGVTITGESPRAQQIEKALAESQSPTQLQQLGVTWVLVEFHTGGATVVSPEVLQTLPLVYRDNDLALYYVGGHSQFSVPEPQSRTLAIGAHLLWMALLIIGAAAKAIQMTAKLRRNRSTQT